MNTIQGKTIVIVGASSGIGRATALALASAGANLVLASRRDTVLAELVDECKKRGGHATFFPVDVTKPEMVRQLAEFAIRTFGHVDVWINNAGAGVMGNFDEIPIEVHDQVVRVSLMGHLHGTHAILSHFKERGAGTIINTNSIGAYIPEIYGVAYSASKYGLRGYSEALREELEPWPGIHICDVFPAYIDTPGYQHAGNYTGKKLRPAPPVYTAERVAQVMVSLVSSPRNSVIVGESGHLMRFFHGLFPGLTRKGLKLMMDNYFSRAQPASITDGALFHPIDTGKGTSGGWRSPKENAITNIAGSLLLAGLAAGIYLLAKRKS